MKPRIAIPVPTSTDLPYNQRSWPQYADCVALSGGLPVEVRLGIPVAELHLLLNSCDGALLPGSPADVDPSLYGAERLPECAASDPGREALDYALLDDAARYGKPLLGICYGLQSLNTWRGGSLVQDLTPLPVNHSAGGKVAVAHTAVVAEGSRLASLLDAKEAPSHGKFLRLPVNSSHHQAAASPGEGLRVVARCPEEGVIEALELDPDVDLRPAAEESDFETDSEPVFHVEQSEERTPQFLIGVQWHPERSFEISAASRALFKELVTSAARVAHRRVTRRED